MENIMKKYDVVALGELLIDFTENGKSNQGNPLFEANPGGAPCNVLAMLTKLGHKTAFIGKVGGRFFRGSHNLHKKISTHLLTLLIINAILQLEQRKGIKRERKKKAL